MRVSPASVVLAVTGLACGALGLSATVGAADRSGIRRTPVVAAVERAAPGVVNITTDIAKRNWSGFTTRGSGSGVIVHPAGYVVTNSHVVRESARIFVELSRAGGAKGRSYPATLLEDDPGHDLALLRISRPEPFPTVSLCLTGDVMVGETAIAIGNPLGLGDTVTVGIVSAVGRSAAMPGGVTLRNLLQTDASINRGNSGGALLNLEGDLIGINCSIHPGAQGISFTVPADDVLAMLRRNLGNAAPRPADDPPVAKSPPLATRTPPSNAAPPARATLPPPSAIVAPAPRRGGTVGLGMRQTGGRVVVVSVDPYSSADLAGLLPGDVIVDVDGKAVLASGDVQAAVASSPEGGTVLLDLLRDGRPKRAMLVVPGS